jgi:hypothetical protein
MKQSFIGILMVFTLFTACNQNKGNDSKESRDTTVTTTTTTHNTDVTAISGDELSKLAPLTEEEIRAIVPASINGARQTDMDVNAAIGAQSAVAEYQLNDSTRVELVIIDCAGPGGAGIYNLQYIGMLGLSEEDEEEYTRTVDFQGGKAFENCSKTRLQCSLTWFTKRFLVSVDGNLPADEIRKIAASVKL